MQELKKLYLSFVDKVATWEELGHFFTSCSTQTKLGKDAHFGLSKN